MAQQGHNAAFPTERAEKDIVLWLCKEMALWFHSQPDQNVWSSLPFMSCISLVGLRGDVPVYTTWTPLPVVAKATVDVLVGYYLSEPSWSRVTLQT